ncbi:hypothetical protein [Pandoraea terrae]|uniref:hypothetical protein n=1 Tax=Pandoraea terrae TaxID=1537710 RepID=UPI00177B3DCA|nr:hypothetical protein [Pandoraea terrae]
MRFVLCEMVLAGIAAAVMVPGAFEAGDARLLRFPIEGNMHGNADKDCERADRLEQG